MRRGEKEKKRTFTRYTNSAGIMFFFFFPALFSPSGYVFQTS